MSQVLVCDGCQETIDPMTGAPYITARFQQVQHVGEAINVGTETLQHYHPEHAPTGLVVETEAGAS